MAVSEFGIDAQDNWKRYLEDSRADYRESQVKAMVAEHPELAVTALSELGYEIDGSNTKQLKQRPFDSLRVY
ncbi:hypothetical protein [Winkia neuii]|nr:hypothetical protein [Winkia neuii]